jgi:hypothetical protein
MPVILLLIIQQFYFLIYFLQIRFLKKAHSETKCIKTSSAFFCLFLQQDSHSFSILFNVGNQTLFNEEQYVKMHVLTLANSI